jgi:hypothetical protein
VESELDDTYRAMVGTVPRHNPSIPSSRTTCLNAGDIRLPCTQGASETPYRSATRMRHRRAKLHPPSTAPTTLLHPRLQQIQWLQHDGARETGQRSRRKMMVCFVGARRPEEFRSRGTRTCCHDDPISIGRRHCTRRRTTLRWRRRRCLVDGLPNISRNKILVFSI